MKKSETMLLLAKIAVIDNRRLDPPLVRNEHPEVLNSAERTPIMHAWYELVGDLNLSDCLDAVAEFRRTSDDWLTPKRVIDGVRKIRDERLDTGPVMGELMADVDPTIAGDEWARIYRERRKVVADGRSDRLRALSGGRP